MCVYESGIFDWSLHTECTLYNSDADVISSGDKLDPEIGEEGNMLTSEYLDIWRHLLHRNKAQSVSIANKFRLCIHHVFNAYIGRQITQGQWIL